MKTDRVDAPPTPTHAHGSHKHPDMDVESIGSLMHTHTHAHTRSRTRIRGAEKFPLLSRDSETPKIKSNAIDAIYMTTQR